MNKEKLLQDYIFTAKYSRIKLDNKKEVWDLENNPIHTINNLRDGTTSTNPFGGVIYNSFEFVKVIPKIVDNSGNKTEWYDEAYEQIENGKEINN